MAPVVQSSCKLLPSRLRLSSIYLSSRRAATTTCTASKVDPPTIANLCEKAHLILTPKEVKDFEPQIGRFVDWFAQLQDIHLPFESVHGRSNIAQLQDVHSMVCLLHNLKSFCTSGEIDPTKTLRPDTEIFAGRSCKFLLQTEMGPSSEFQ